MAGKALSVLQKVAAAKAQAKTLAGTVCKADTARYPGLVELLTSLVDGSGKKREPARLAICPDLTDGGWKVRINDPSEAAVLWTHSDTLEGALDAAEAHVQSEAPDWREDHWATITQPAKGKKGR